MLRVHHRGETTISAEFGIPHPVGGKSTPVFHPDLSWSHYRALMRMTDDGARDYFDAEAAHTIWSRCELKRQIHSLCYQRLLASTNHAAMLHTQRQTEQVLRPIDILKDPYVLEPLGLQNSSQFHESRLEEAIIQMPQFLRHQIPPRNQEDERDRGMRPIKNSNNGTLG